MIDTLNDTFEDKHIRIYRRDDKILLHIVNELSGQWGRRATYADAISFLVKRYENEQASDRLADQQ